MVLHTFNRTLLEPPTGPYEEQTIHGMLKHWAAATPAAPAVEFEVCLQPDAGLWRLLGLALGQSEGHKPCCRVTSRPGQTSFRKHYVPFDQANQQVCWRIQAGHHPHAYVQAMLMHVFCE